MRACPVCSEVVFLIRAIPSTNEKYYIYKCSACRLEFVNPIPSKEALDRFYSTYEDIRAGREVLERNAKRNMAFLAQLGINRASTLLDYGSGKNIFVSASGIDAWKSYDRYTPNNDLGLLKENCYDCITAWGVLEHVEDPMHMVKQLTECLRPGGYLVMTTVDIDRAIPFRYKPPEHLTYWSREAVFVLFEKNGLSLTKYVDYFMVQDKFVYMDIILRTMPSVYKDKVKFDQLPNIVEIPTNEVVIVGRKNSSS